MMDIEHRGSYGRESMANEMMAMRSKLGMDNTLKSMDNLLEARSEDAAATLRLKEFE